MDASSATGAVHRPGRGRVFDSIVDAIGDTPIVRLRNLPKQHGVNATIPPSWNISIRPRA
jgi:cysteine synthase A